MRVTRFFRTPKGLLIVVLAILAIVAVVDAGFMLAVPGLGAAVGVAMLIDTPVLRVQRGRWHFPDGALLTGMIVGMILSPHNPWYVAAVTSAIAMLSKYLFRVRTENVFNPAAFALVATFYPFSAAHSWWGALPDLSPAALIALVGAGVFITVRVNKLAVMLSFLGVYYLLFTIVAFAGNPARVADMYRAPNLHAALFFALFMVTDPPTSPPEHRDQFVYGVIAAAASFAAFELIGAAYFLLAGLLVANLWEARRRVRARAARL